MGKVEICKFLKVYLVKNVYVTAFSQSDSKVSICYPLGGMWIQDRMVQ